MKTFLHTSYQSFCLLICLFVWSCDSMHNNDPASGQERNETIISQDSTSTADTSLEKKAIKEDTVSVMVLPCANGYEYAMSNFELDPLLEVALSASENIQVIRFPLKAMMGVAYQGVFDVKYCMPIIKKVVVDYLVLSRFDEEYHELNRTNRSWGYEVRIVNTHTLEQVNSMEAHNLEEYAEIEQHIKANIGKLVADIEEME